MGKARSVNFCVFCGVSFAGHFRRKATPSYDGKPKVGARGTASGLGPFSGPLVRAAGRCRPWASVSLGTEASPRRGVERDVRGEELLVASVD